MRVSSLAALAWIEWCKEAAADASGGRLAASLI